MTLGWAGRTTLVAVVLVAGAMPVAQGQRHGSDTPDLDAIYLIKDEAFQRSEVMDIVSYLTDVYGPRLTGSPNLRRAAEYTIAKMRAWGLANPQLETWGEFGPGWSNDRFAAHVVEPQAYPLIGSPRAFTPGTDGTVRGRAVLAPITAEEDFDTWRGRLGGAFVFASRLRNVDAAFEPLGRRMTDEELEALADQPAPRRAPDAERGGGRGGGGTNARELARRRMQFFVDEGVLAVMEYSRGDGGTIFVTGGNLRQFPDQTVPAQIVLSVEHYGRIVRTLEKDIQVTIEMNVQNTFHDEDLTAFTIVGEIPGTDKADEVVMLGAHFDSWHTGTGATDNAAGAAVMLEAMRILKATGLEMNRTVRIGLWTGEEQGLQGSRAYVAKHFADRETMRLEPEHGRFSAYYNLDNGTGLIRGVYLQGNEAVAPIFRAWMEPLENLGMTTLAIRGTGGTDHTSFDAVGLPGFQFIQDPIEYDTRTHHSNMDVYERVQRPDLIRNAAIIATFAYHTATRDELLPRKPLPRPAPATNDGGSQ